MSTLVKSLSNQKIALEDSNQDISPEILTRDNNLHSVSILLNTQSKNVNNYV